MNLFFVLMKIIKSTLIGLLVILCYIDFASSKTIDKYTEVEIQGPGQKNKIIDGKNYEKTSSIFEYKFENVTPSLNNIQGDLLSFDLSKDVVGMSIVIYTKGKYHGFVKKLIGPDNIEIISPSPSNVSPEIISGLGGRGQMVSINGTLPDVFKEISITPVPNSDKVKMKKGKWKMEIAIEGSHVDVESIDVSVLIKRAKKLTKETRGHFTLIINSANELFNQSSSAENISNTLEVTKNAYKQAGIEISVLKNQALSNSRYDQSCANEKQKCFLDLIELFKIPSRDEKIKPGELNAYFLKMTNFTSGGVANYGGAASMMTANYKQRFGGVVVWVEKLQESFLNGMVLAHELGHYLGLYHTDVDNISDTKSYNHFIHVNEGPTREESENIMTDGIIQTNKTPVSGFTPGQKNVLMRSIGVELYHPSLK